MYSSSGERRVLGQGSNVQDTTARHRQGGENGKLYSSAVLLFTVVVALYYITSYILPGRVKLGGRSGYYYWVDDDTSDVDWD